MFAYCFLRCELKLYSAVLLLCFLLAGCNTTLVDKASIYYDRAGYAVDVRRDIPEINEAVLQGKVGVRSCLLLYLYYV